LPPDQPVEDHCGSCRKCIDVCPTRAITAPYQLDATRCISYLTIELKGSIPEEFRSAIGNRVYGCDDCQAVCPWNRYAQFTGEDDFRPRKDLDSGTLTELFGWVGLGNAPTSPAVVHALESRRNHPSSLVREHVEWALARHR